MRIGCAASAKDRSLESPVIRESLTPTAGRKVNSVTVGPMETLAHLHLYAKVRDVRLIIETFALISPERGVSLSV